MIYLLVLLYGYKTAGNAFCSRDLKKIPGTVEIRYDKYEDKENTAYMRERAFGGGAALFRVQEGRGAVDVKRGDELLDALDPVGREQRREFCR